MTTFIHSTEGAGLNQLSASRGAKLHFGHFAFMRAVVQGLDTRESWERYLRIAGEHDDIRNVRRTIQWIRDEFAAAARRSARPGTARLIQLDASRIADTGAAVPTLEEFAIEHGLEDFSQAEQLEFYREKVGVAPGAQSRRKRVIARQLDALHWLEQLAVQPPRPEDPIGYWLNPDMARRLADAGIFTLRALIARINGRGHRWWIGIRAIGAGKAERIVAWLRSQETSIGLGLGPHVLIPRRKLNVQHMQDAIKTPMRVVPIEKLIVPEELSGMTGGYRAPREICRIDADDDRAAILAWVKSKGAGSQGPEDVQRDQQWAGAERQHRWLGKLNNTQRAYLKEAERFLIWAIVQRTKAISAITTEDCRAYLDFIADPTPAEIWCGRRNREKWSPLWRPFEGPLSVSARRHSAAVLKSLYTFLVEQGYLTVNPWKTRYEFPDSHNDLTTKVTFNEDDWNFMHAQANALPRTSANMRLAFALRLFQQTQIRLTEAVAAQTDDVKALPDCAQTSVSMNAGIVAQVFIKGKRARSIGVDQQFILHLQEYLTARGLAREYSNELNRGAYLLGKATDVAERAPWSPLHRRCVDSKEGVAPGTLYDQLKSFFGNCSAVMIATDPKRAAMFAAASTNWLSRSGRNGKPTSSEKVLRGSVDQMS